MSEDNLYGNAPEKHPLTVMLIDVINDFEFPEGDLLFPSAYRAAGAIQTLIGWAHGKGIPIIYVNDNFGRWRSDFRAQVEHCLQDGTRGERIVRRLAPTPDDYYVLKTKHSGFFATPLELLLDAMKTQTLILAGFTADACVQYSAMDAYLRDFQIVICQDGVASFSLQQKRNALQYCKSHFNATLLTAKLIAGEGLDSKGQ